jgi:hypothetical protein
MLFQDSAEALFVLLFDLFEFRLEVVLHLLHLLLKKLFQFIHMRY